MVAKNVDAGLVQLGVKQIVKVLRGPGFGAALRLARQAFRGKTVRNPAYGWRMARVWQVYGTCLA